ncbi:MAG: molybdate ABC transporter substrate-binding protein [Anaerolineae bacterium]|nr:molybdate ABC transporter substrate-binding protein [Anaerolineae bacterium]
MHFPLRHLLVASFMLLAACSLGEGAQRQTLTVYAAASLSGAFAEIAEQYEWEHPGVSVRLNLGGSQQLAQQLVQGAPADLFASANTEQMRVAQEAGRVAPGTEVLFATNRLVVITPPGGTEVDTLVDLVRPGVRVILADEAVPAGRYARAFLMRAGVAGGLGDDYEKNVLGNVVSYEQNVRAVLTKVALGEADAGVVYESDALAGDVGRIAIPAELNVVASYAIAPVADGAEANAASFIAFVLSPRGQAILASYGFGAVTGMES